MLRLSFAEIAGIERWILAIREFIVILLIINCIHTTLCMLTDQINRVEGRKRQAENRH